MITLPDSGPTASFHCNQFRRLSLASARVVTTPRAAAPTPPAITAAAIGPSGLSANGMPARRSWATCCLVGWSMPATSLDDRGDLGDEGPKGPRHRGKGERQHEQDDRGPADEVVADQVGAVVQ